TYNQWRGYPQVTVKVGDPAEGPQQVTRTRYYRGMHGQPLPGGGTRSVQAVGSEGHEYTDHRALVGQVLETMSLLTGSIDSATVHRYWRQKTASRSDDGGTSEAWLTGVDRQETRQRLVGTTWQRTRVDTTYDQYGRPVEVHDRGDISVPTDRR